VERKQGKKRSCIQKKAQERDRGNASRDEKICTYLMHRKEVSGKEKKNESWLERDDN